MITQEDIDAFSIVNVTPMEYSYWVEGKITTKGETRLVENALGLVGEAGEVADKVKKWMRDGRMNKLEIAKEIGDTLWYASLAADDLGYTLSEIALLNLEKLDKRKKSGKIKGSGDNR